MTTTFLSAFLSILTIVCGTARASDDKQEQQLPNRQKYQVMSPQAADFIRYDNTSITETSGRLDLSIPVISFNDPDFHFLQLLRIQAIGAGQLRREKLDAEFRRNDLP